MVESDVMIVIIVVVLMVIGYTWSFDYVVVKAFIAVKASNFNSEGGSRHLVCNVWGDEENTGDGGDKGCNRGDD